MKNKKIIFIDLDGTVLDVSERIYRLYCDILKKYKKRILSKRKYLNLKRQRKPVKEILAKTKAIDIFLKFQKEWEKKIENYNYLKLDKISSLNRKKILSLKNQYKLVLVTLRNHPRRLFRQLKEMNIDKIFDKVLVIRERDPVNKRDKWKLKVRAIKKYKNFNKNSVIIGDTETDILAGKRLGIKTVAVANGMRDKKFLKKYKPNILIKNFSEIENFLLM